MAENDSDDPITPSFPTGRVKKIMKIDKDINKVNAEALHLISCSTDVFLQFLAERSAAVATEKKRKIVKLEHLRTAAKRHLPTSDFLLDSLPAPQSLPVVDGPAAEIRARPAEVKPAPAGTRRIDQIFAKSGKEAAGSIIET
uniref:Transcription factor CBF/NF-Y/archaeal histone domain-containing protein n=1 Tax=Kalanchoe fedtschenkoi TaxID=63787 RepID=A0A7N0VMG3_KALFE